MPTKAEQAAAKAERIRAARPQRSDPALAPESSPATALSEPAAPPVAGSPTPRVGRTAMVRMTVDLTPQMHADLEDWARDTARSSGRTRVTRVDVVRELVRQLLADDALAETVRRQVSQTSQ